MLMFLLGDQKQINKGHLSIKARNLCLSICLSVCVYVFLKYPCGSGSDWPESFHMAAAWFKGICIISNKKLFVKHICGFHSKKI